MDMGAAVVPKIARLSSRRRIIIMIVFMMLYINNNQCTRYVDVLSGVVSNVKSLIIVDTTRIIDLCGSESFRAKIIMLTFLFCVDHFLVY